PGGQLPGDGLHGALVHRNPVVGQGVGGPALFVEPGQPRLTQPLHQGPPRVAGDPLPGLPEGEVEPDGHVGRSQKLAGLGLGPGAAPQGDHLAPPGQHLRQGLHLPAAEGGLPFLAEELGDGPPAPLDDGLVQVAEGQAQLPGDRPSHRALPRPTETHQKQVGRPDGQLARGGQLGRIQGAHQYPPKRDRSAAEAASVAWTASPPNLSTPATASSQATTASPTTAAAGSAQVSLRSMAASTGPFSSTSTDGRGRQRVGRGFMAARTTRGAPMVTPPSSPPARLVAREYPPPRNCPSTGGG